LFVRAFGRLNAQQRQPALRCLALKHLSPYLFR
jgi:hypothetical protein